MDINLTLNGEVFGRVDGVVRKISIGADIRQRIVEAVGSGETIKVSRIAFDRDFLERFGRVRAYIMTKVGEDEKIWKEIIDNTIIEYDLNTKNNAISKNTGKHINHKSGSTARIATGS